MPRHTRSKSKHGRRNRRKSNKLRGGKFVAKGTYGCVFRPNLPCPDETGPTSNVVSKVMESMEAQKERGEFTSIDAVDPKFLFHLPAPKICDYQRKYDDEEGMNRCHIRKENDPDDMSILQYKDGGMALDKFLHTYKFNSETKIKAFMQNFHTFILGLDVMAKGEYTHSDIKLPNLVVNPKTMQMNYIDFGLSGKYGDIMGNEDKTFLYDLGYFPFPSESSLLERYTYEQAKRKPEWFFEHIKSLYPKYHANVTDDELFGEQDHSIYKPTWESKKEKYVDDLKNKSYNVLFKEIISKLDTFSIGIVLFKCINAIAFAMRKFELDTPTLKEIKRVGRRIAHNMTRPYYGERYSAAKALKEYESQMMPLVGPIVKRSVPRKPVSTAAAAAAASGASVSAVPPGPPGLFSPGKTRKAAPLPVVPEETDTELGAGAAAAAASGSSPTKGGRRRKHKTRKRTHKKSKASRGRKRKTGKRKTRKH